MTKKLSLRGSFILDDNARLVDLVLFQYEANDLTKGWVVEGAYVWPKQTRAVTGSGGDTQYQACWSLASDTLGYDGYAPGFDDLCSSSDNRQIGWLQAGYQHRDNGSDDFLANSGNGPNPAAFVVDPEHVIANGIWLNGYTTSESGLSPSREWNYMVILRPKKLDPKETILHLIKNVAQDIVL